MSEIKISYEKLRQRSLFLGLPCYGGQMSANTAMSLMQLVAKCNEIGIKLHPYSLMNESLVPRARNYCADTFLRSECTHLMFIDSDIGFKADDVITLLALQSEDPADDDYDVIAGVYPKKMISYEKVKAAVDAGMADENPDDLANFVGDYVFNPVKAGDIKLSEPAEVLETGTGFMMIRRATFDKYKEAYPELSFKPDHRRTEAFDGSREVHAYFDTVICPKTKRYLSEDYQFCQWTRNAGMKIWICPWINLKHYGNFEFGGSLAALASINASPTLDESKIVKKKL